MRTNIVGTNCTCGHLVLLDQLEARFRSNRSITTIDAPRRCELIDQASERVVQRRGAQVHAASSRPSASPAPERPDAVAERASDRLAF